MSISANNVVDFGSINQPKKKQGDASEAREAKLESSVEYIQRDIVDIKDDIKGIRTERITRASRQRTSHFVW